MKNYKAEIEKILETYFMDEYHYEQWKTGASNPAVESILSLIREIVQEAIPENPKFIVDFQGHKIANPVGEFRNQFRSEILSNVEEILT